MVHALSIQAGFYGRNSASQPAKTSVLHRLKPAAAPMNQVFAGRGQIRGVSGRNILVATACPSEDFRPNVDVASAQHFGEHSQKVLDGLGFTSWLLTDEMLQTLQSTESGTALVFNGHSQIGSVTADERQLIMDLWNNAISAAATMMDSRAGLLLMAKGASVDDVRRTLANLIPPQLLAQRWPLIGTCIQWNENQEVKNSQAVLIAQIYDLIASQSVMDFQNQPIIQKLEVIYNHGLESYKNNELDDITLEQLREACLDNVKEISSLYTRDMIGHSQDFDRFVVELKELLMLKQMQWMIVRSEALLEGLAPVNQDDSGESNEFTIHAEPAEQHAAAFNYQNIESFSGEYQVDHHWLAAEMAEKGRLFDPGSPVFATYLLNKPMTLVGIEPSALPLMVIQKNATRTDVESGLDQLFGHLLKEVDRAALIEQSQRRAVLNKAVFISLAEVRNQCLHDFWMLVLCNPRIRETRLVLKGFHGSYVKMPEEVRAAFYAGYAKTIQDTMRSVYNESGKPIGMISQDKFVNLAKRIFVSTIYSPFDSFGALSSDLRKLIQDEFGGGLSDSTHYQ